MQVRTPRAQEGESHDSNLSGLRLGSTAHGVVQTLPMDGHAGCVVFLVLLPSIYLLASVPSLARMFVGLARSSLPSRWCVLTAV